MDALDLSMLPSRYPSSFSLCSLDLKNPLVAVLDQGLDHFERVDGHPDLLRDDYSLLTTHWYFLTILSETSVNSPVSSSRTGVFTISRIARTSWMALEKSPACRSRSKSSVSR